MFISQEKLIKYIMRKGIMKKGISTVVATLLLLIITIGMTSLVAGYLFGYIGRSTSNPITVVSSDCSGGTATVVLRNEGTANITANQISFTVINAACSGLPPGPAITAGNTGYATFTGCAPGRQHTFRAIGPSNTVQITFFCS